MPERSICCRAVLEGRSSAVVTDASVLFYSGLAFLGAGAGMVRCGFGNCVAFEFLEEFRKRTMG